MTKNRIAPGYRSYHRSVGARALFALAVIYSLIGSGQRAQALEEGSISEEIHSLSALSDMPVREVSIFKDGHAFIRHHGKLPVDNDGRVVMRYLPKPVLGTFWPYTFEPNTKLKSVLASKQPVKVSMTALEISELLEANLGADVRVDELVGGGDEMEVKTYDATILKIPTRDVNELEEIAEPGSIRKRKPEKSSLVLLKTADGTRAVSIKNIQNLTFLNDFSSKFTKEEFRNTLTLGFHWSKERKTEADVGLMYLQQGIRWIPNYKIDIDGIGEARVELQATIINDLTDFRNANLNLVVGVPSFKFEGVMDPIWLGVDNEQYLDQSIFPSAQGGLLSMSAGRRSMISAMSNALTTQTISNVSSGPGIGSGNAAGGQMPIFDSSDAAKKSEDFFVFTVDDVSLGRNERVILPIAYYNLKYEDIYSLDVPMAPPPEMSQYASSSGNSRADTNPSPLVKHKLRFENTGKHPFTTAPVLISKAGAVLCQSQMRYAPPGAKNDLELTTAVDIQVEKSEREILRTPNAVKIGNDSYTEVQLEGKLVLTNRSGKKVKVEAKRHVLGKLLSASAGAKQEAINILEEKNFEYPLWWSWYHWPSWWNRMNGIGRATWHFELKPGEKKELDYKWSYRWR